MEFFIGILTGVFIGGILMVLISAAVAADDDPFGKDGSL